MSILQTRMLKVELQPAWGTLLATEASARPLHHDEQHALPTKTMPERAGGDLTDGVVLTYGGGRTSTSLGDSITVKHNQLECSTKQSSCPLAPGFDARSPQRSHTTEGGQKSLHSRTSPLYLAEWHFRLRITLLLTSPWLC